METALKLLHDRQIPLCSTIECINLVDLLESGIPLELPDGKRLTVLELHSDSPHVGKEAHSDALADTYVEQDLVLVSK